MTPVAVVDAQDRVERAELVLVRGTVQGVGFRPLVWRLAARYHLRGSVSNDGAGVRIHVCGASEEIDSFVGALAREAPPLARIARIERAAAELIAADRPFEISASETTAARTSVAADAAACVRCVQEIFDPSARRYRYPFTNCTHCGPRLSIITSVPYDRAATTMRGFELCAACAGEYRNPADRRFHAQPVACHVCGPRVTLVRADGVALALDALTTVDATDAACTLLHRGHIVAIKGLGGYQLACDATQEAVVARLRAGKRRGRKPFALMARDLDVIMRYCAPSEIEIGLLQNAAAPIVLVPARPGSDDSQSDSGFDPEFVAAAIAPSVAPGVKTLGFMLPNSPLHQLLLRRMNRPIVLTSGNLADEPQCIDDDEARTRLHGLAEYFLAHDRPIARRVDDSVVRVFAGEPRIVRRARGYAPAPLSLPAEFAAARPVLAMGAQLKNTFCLLRDGAAIVSHHMGDLENAPSFADFKRNVADYLALFQHKPQAIAVDLHPDYLSRKHGQALATEHALPLIEVQHHHAHIAACLAENQYPLAAPPVIGVALDGLGIGDDGALWGGEFLLADYRSSERVAMFRPVAMPGGEQAMHEPWRNTYAHLRVSMGWSRFALNFSELELFEFLEQQPRDLLAKMIDGNINSPRASSCGRLFDAVAAAAGVCRGHAFYEGQAAIEFEALLDHDALVAEDDELAYPFAIPRWQANGLPYIEASAMWQALLGDLTLKTPVGIISARFHKGLAMVIARMTDKLRCCAGADTGIRTVALSGGVFQNRVLLEQVLARLRALDFNVLTHRQVPANDGGIALGQAAVAAARALAH